MPEQFFTPPEAAELLGVKADKVLGWIHSGELVAHNCATDPNGERPRWRIADDELGRFLLRRRNPAAIEREARPKRKRRSRVADPIFS
ncbi:MAG: helix-turn-helix domain-containing protein [Phycisphaera sp. RhM]|nr:helix-turn-helix domain-containing protein [Phycisphaera sp. RhM]